MLRKIIVKLSSLENVLFSINISDDRVSFSDPDRSKLSLKNEKKINLIFEEPERPL
jgi:hypothetical protein